MADRFQELGAAVLESALPHQVLTEMNTVAQEVRDEWSLRSGLPVYDHVLYFAMEGVIKRHREKQNANV